MKLKLKEEKVKFQSIVQEKMKELRKESEGSSEKKTDK